MTAPGAIAGQLDRLGQQTEPATARLPSPPTKTTVERAYLTALFDDAQTVWRRDFATAHLAYHGARLVVFWSTVRSACGHHNDSGPFYCSADETIYLDLRFFTHFVRDVHLGGAAQAYIIGHEFGHHVQHLLGIDRRIDAANKVAPSGENARSVRAELEADCLSGVWANSAYPRSELTFSELYDALKAAELIGDDYLMQAAGDVVDSAVWTHGSSQQRQQWLRTGFRNGRPSACDTFASG